MSSSVSLWIDQLKQGDDSAAQNLWERYYQRLVGLAKRKLGEMPKRVADEEDVVAGAFQSFFQRAKEGQFPQLADRDDLWRLLVTITARKAMNQIQHQQRAKRGGGRVHGESVLGNSQEGDGGIAGFIGNEPTPEFTAQFVEMFQATMDSLDDPTYCVIALYKFEGRTNPEIATHLDCSLTSVERKLRMIRKILSAEEHEDE